MTIRQELDEIDRREEEYMIPLNCKDRGTPFVPVGPSRPVRRGAPREGCSGAIWRSEERNRRLTQ